MTEPVSTVVPATAKVVYQNMLWAQKKQHIDWWREEGEGLTLIVCNKAQDIIVLVKADNNSNILCFLYSPLNNTAKIKSFGPI